MVSSFRTHTLVNPIVLSKLMICALCSRNPTVQSQCVNKDPCSLDILPKLPDVLFSPLLYPLITCRNTSYYDLLGRTIELKRMINVSKRVASITNL